MIHILFDAFKESDLPQLFLWLRQPHVAMRWKTSNDFDVFAKKYHPLVLQKNYIFPFIININGKDIGYIEYCLCGKARGGWWEHYKGGCNGTVGMYIVVGDLDCVGKGYSAAIVKKFVKKIFDETDVDKVIVNIDPKNVAASRCYVSAGFMRVGAIEIQERKGVLMELERGIC